MSLRAWAVGAAGFITLTSSTTGPTLARAPRDNSWHEIERTSFAWRPRGAPYTLVVEENHQEHRLLIVSPDGRSTIVAPEPHIMKLTDRDDDGREEPKNLVKDKLTHTDFAYATPRLRGPDGAPLLLVQQGSDDATSGDLRLYALDQQGHPSLLTVVEEFELIAIVDLAGDGEPELAGIRSYSEMTRCTLTYDPRSVMRFADRTHTRLVYSRALSRAFNRKYYYGWWDRPYANEEISVALCGKHTGKLIGRAEARALDDGPYFRNGQDDVPPLPEIP
jgi:hypothetical protein